MKQSTKKKSGVKKTSTKKSGVSIKSSQSGILKEIGLARDKAKDRQTANIIMGRVYPEYKNCSECHGTLYKEDGTMCECMRDYVIKTKLRSANIGSKYFDVNTDFYKKNMKGMYIKFLNNKQKDVNFFIDYLNKYVETFPNRLEDGRGFLISGETGCGKTGALCYVIKQLAIKNYNVYYLDTNELLSLISSSYDNSDLVAKKQALDTLERLKEVDLLVLDDFGSEYSKSLEWLYNIFLKLIKSRYAKNKPTLMSTNLALDSLMDKFSEDVAPRLSSVFSESFESFAMFNTVDMRKSYGRTKSLYDDMKKELGE